MQSTNTIVEPDTIPGALSGRYTVRNAAKGVAPRLVAARSVLGSIFFITANSAMIMIGIRIWTSASVELKRVKSISGGGSQPRVLRAIETGPRLPRMMIQA